MTLLNVIDLDDILTVNSMWEKKNWVMGGSGRIFGLEVMFWKLRKSKFKS